MRARLLLPLLLSLSPSAGAAPKDCGRLPKGQNPTVEELDAEIAKVSAEHKVPTEIIKAVAWQESGCQQWRADGTFVYNTTDCGLGMMQLTGDTAKQFDVERLKDDWRYNLACGVKVLVAKWARAEREGLVPPDPQVRRVLENWYYAVAYYWGRKEETYLRKIFTHLEKRPGKLAQLLRRSVSVSVASDVIPGFTFGQKFLAQEDKLIDKDGKAHAAPTHLGTIGDPETLARLDVLLARAKKSVEAGRTATALKYLAEVTAADFDTGHKAEAEAIVKALVEAAEKLLAEARGLRAAGDATSALRLLRKVARDYKGHPVAERAAAEVEALKGAG